MSTEASTVLVVEDDPGIATLQRRRLERAGFIVKVAVTVEEALAALVADNVSLVTVDYRLGETTGLDLHRRMKAAGHNIPVILVSGTMDDSAVVDALRAGVRDVVVKTAGYLDRLPDAVTGVLKQAGTAAPAATSSKTCVLIVEDDPGTATLERRQLERAGYSVLVAASVDDAVAAVREKSVGLAILDLRLPGGTSGLELYERWQQEGIRVPAILVTGFADQAVAIRAIRLGIRDFVPKTHDFLDYLGSAVDRVIAQERVEQKLADSELRLASIIGTAMDAILMCDSASRIVLFNRAAEEMFECSVADAIGLPVTRLIPRLHLTTAPQDALRSRSELEGTRLRSGESLPIEVSVTDLRIQDHRMFTVIARDITERKRSEEELRDADRRKDEFLGMLAHELRNPLAAIMTAGEVLHRGPSDEQRSKLNDVIRRQSRALSRMVDDLLDVSRVTLGKIQLTREPLILGQTVARAADSVRTQAAAAGITLHVHTDGEPLWIEGDTTRLEQVVTNLLTNATKFTPRGGHVTVSVQRDDDAAVVRVDDTGIGIDGALLPRVFDLFVQGDSSLDRSRSGLGIGLALVRRIVTMHGGTVAASSPGRGLGSSFTLRLPLAARDQTPIETAAGAASDQARLNVVVVDDQRDVADMVASLIHVLGHDVHTAYDGATALNLSRETRPDVMFVDIGMPDMTGYEVAEQVRRDPEISGMQLVALTGYGREEDRNRVMQAGFDFHRVKPLTDADLQATLSAVATAMGARS
jgi:PAS domain S-box-containing protein